jgi:hypothetical protein
MALRRRGGRDDAALNDENRKYEQQPVFQSHGYLPTLLFAPFTS